MLHENHHQYILLLNEPSIKEELTCKSLQSFKTHFQLSKRQPRKWSNTLKQFAAADKLLEFV